MLYVFKNYDQHDIKDELNIEINDMVHVHVDYQLLYLQVDGK